VKYELMSDDVFRKSFVRNTALQMPHLSLSYTQRELFSKGDCIVEVTLLHFDIGPSLLYCQLSQHLTITEAFQPSAYISFVIPSSLSINTPSFTLTQASNTSSPRPTPRPIDLLEISSLHHFSHPQDIIRLVNTDAFFKFIQCTRRMFLSKDILRIIGKFDVFAKRFTLIVETGVLVVAVIYISSEVGEGVKILYRSWDSGAKIQECKREECALKVHCGIKSKWRVR